MFNKKELRVIKETLGYYIHDASHDEPSGCCGLYHDKKEYEKFNNVLKKVDRFLSTLPNSNFTVTAKKPSPKSCSNPSCPKCESSFQNDNINCWNCGTKLPWSKTS